MKVLFIHDWLLGMRGGERCLEELCRLFPDSDVLTLFLNAEKISPEIRARQIQPSFLNKLPGVRRYYRHLLPFYPLAVTDLSRKIERLIEKNRYELVISVSHCVAKNVLVPFGVKHICYCLTPMRYIWDQYDAYFAGRALEPLIRQVAAPLRRWDVARAANVDQYVAISEFVRARIRTYYRRDADVVFPPVRTDWIRPAEKSGSGFLCVSALVPYKNVGAIVEAFNHLPFELTVVGDGPERSALERRAKRNIRFVRGISEAELAELYRGAKALVFGAEEDFGMAPVESLAAGRPVIAYGRGGVLETVGFDGERPMGVPFLEPTPEQIARAVYSFLDREKEFPVEKCVERAAEFSVERFNDAFLRVVERVTRRRIRSVAAKRLRGAVE